VGAVMGFFSKLVREVKRAVKDVVEVVEDTGKAIGVVLGLREQEAPDYDISSLSSSLSSSDSSTTGVLLNKTAASSSISVVVGTRRVGGARVLLHTQGEKNADLYSVLVLSEGPIQGIRDIEINDEKVSAIGGSDNYTVGDGSRISLTPDVSLCGHFGSWSQSVDASFSSNLGSLWTSAHKLTGLAYTATRYTYNAEKISSLPNQTAVVDGALLYDPRDGQTKFSSNAALVNLFYMRNGVFGERVPDEEIDFESFKVAADIADRTAETFAGSGVTYKPVDINAVINTGKSRLDNMKALLAHSHASLPYSEGKYRLVIRSAVYASFEFNADNISGDISIASSGASNKYNRVAVKFVDPDLNWQENTVIYPTDDSEYQQLLADDNGIEKHADITADMVTNKYQALDYGRRYLYESRKGLSISLTALPAARKVLPGQVVELNSSNLGSFLFTVTKRTITSSGEYSFTLKEYDPSIYSWINQTEITSGETPTLPSIYNIQPPTNLTFEKVDYNADYQGVLSWDDSASAFVTRYKIDIYNTVTGLLAWSNQITANNVQIPNLPTGNYRADVKGLSEISGTTVSSIVWDSTIPSLPQIKGLSQSGVFDADLTVSWAPVIAQGALRFYRIEIIVAGTSVLYISSITETATITNAHFESIGYPRNFQINVSAVNLASVIGAAATLTINRSLPATPVIEMIPSVDNIKLSLSSSANRRGTVVWVSTSDPIVMTDVNQKYKGESLSITLDGLLPLTRYYLAVAAYDAFGVGYAVYYSVTTLKDSIGDTINNLSTLDLTQEVSNLDESALLVSLRTGKNQRDILSIKQALSGAGII
jgi:hypothetical protein